MNVQYRGDAKISGSQPLVVSSVGPSRQMLRLRMHVSLLVMDVLCICFSFWLAGMIHPENESHWIAMCASILPVYLIGAFGARAYSVEVIGHIGRGVGRAMGAFAASSVTVLFVAFFLKSTDEFSRLMFAVGLIASASTLAVSRTLFVQGAKSILGGNPYSVVLIADDPAHASWGEFSSVLRTSDFEPTEHCPAMYDRLAEALSSADRVVISCAPQYRLDWVHFLKGANIQAEILAPELAEMRPLGMARLGVNPTLVVARGPLSLPDRVTKRAFDVAVAGFSIVLFAPLLLAAALAVKLDSPGPVFFMQTRIGRGNRLFRMLKFRSMRTDALDHSASKLTSKDDDRVTRIGKFLRRTSIDELPQLLNVLRGEMSIVGPRPHALGARAADQLYWEIDNRYWHRHAAKPGLTGLAQVRGFRGATNHRADLVNRLQADLEYLNRWSLGRDIKIIAMTFGVVIHPNAF